MIRVLYLIILSSVLALRGMSEEWVCINGLLLYKAEALREAFRLGNANPNTKDSSGKSILVQIIERSSVYSEFVLSVIQEFLKTEKLLPEIWGQGLQKAVLGGDIKVIRQMMLWRPHETNLFVCDAICHALYNGHFNIVKEIVDGLQSPNVISLPIKFTSSMNNSYQIMESSTAEDIRRRAMSKELMSAVMEADVQKVERSLAQEADTTIRDKDNLTPLHQAAIKGATEIVKRLLNNYQAVDSVQWTPLFWAALLGHTDVVRLLAQRGVNNRDINGNTPLHFAALSGHLDVARVLIDMGGNVNSQNNSGSTPLHYAACNGHTNIIELLISRGANPQLCNQVGQIALHWSAYRGHAKATALLMPTDVDKEDNYGMTPLGWATLNKHVAVVRLLLGRYAEIHSCQKEVISPLLYLIPMKSALNRLENFDGSLEVAPTKTEIAYPLTTDQSKVQIIELLIAAGADKDFLDSVNGETPLHFAARHGDEIMVRTLIALGADVNAYNQENATCLHMVACLGYPHILKHLLTPKAGLEARDASGRTPLQVAVLSWVTLKGSGSVPYSLVVKELLSVHADVNASDSDGWACIHEAAYWGHARLVELLLKGRAEVNARTKEEQTALHLASEQGYLDVVKILLKEGGDAHACDIRGKTPLELASTEELAQTLREEMPHEEYLTSGEEASVDVKNEQHQQGLNLFSNVRHFHLDTRAEASNRKANSILLKAATSGDVIRVKKALEVGADIGSRDKEGWTALHIAAHYGFVDVIQELINAGRSVSHQFGISNVNTGTTKGSSTALHKAVRAGKIEVVKILLDAGANVNACEKDDWTALHIAAQEGYAPMVKVLHQAGARVDVQQHNGYNALYIASQNGHAEVVEMLITVGERGDTKQKDGYTSLHVACKKGHVNVLEKLLQSDTDVNVCNANNNYTPLHIAARLGHLEVVRLLVKKGAKINILTRKRESALNLAEKSGKREVANYLRNPKM